MKQLRILLSLLLVALCLMGAATSASAADTAISMTNVPITGGENAVFQDSFTDSFGNHYSGVLLLDANPGASATFPLSGQYLRFSGTLAASEQTDSDAIFDFAILVDSKIVYSKQGVTKTTAPESFRIDLTGAQTLQIVVNSNSDYCAYLYVANGTFTVNPQPTAQEAPLPATLSDAHLVDSNHFSKRLLTTDTFGTLHANNYFFGRWGDPFATFNLDKQYDTFTATLFADTNFGGALYRTCAIYCDDKQVAYYEEINKETKPISIRIDVRNVSVLKIEVGARTTSAWNNEGSLVVGDAALTHHIHIPGDVNEDVAATCAADGWKNYLCTVCGNVCNEEIYPAPPHTPVKEWTLITEATCTQEGMEAQLCQVCNQPANTKPVSMLKHKFGDWKTKSGSLWNAPITKVRTCSKCGNSEINYVMLFFWVKPLVLSVLAALALLTALGAHAAKKLCAATVQKRGLLATLRRALFLKEKHLHAVLPKD